MSRRPPRRRRSRLPPGVAPSLLLAALVLPATAAADPFALRLPSRGAPEVVAAVGWPHQSGGFWLTDRLGVAAEVRVPFGSVGGSIGTRATLARGTRGWGLEVFLAGGALHTLAEPGTALTCTASVRGSVIIKAFDLGVGIAIPAVLRVGPGPHPIQGRLPLQVEILLGVDVGPTRIGIAYATGLAITTDGGFSNTMSGSAWLTVPLPRPSVASWAGL